MIEAALRGFSYPPGPEREVLDIINRGVGVSTIRRALDVNADTLKRCAGLEGLLHNWLESPVVAFWHPNISRMKTALNSARKRVPLKYFVETGLIAQLEGAVGSWDFHFEEPTSIWIDRWLLRGTVSGIVEASGREMNIRTRGVAYSESEIYLTRDAEKNGWTNRHSGESIVELPVVNFAPSRRIVILPEEIVEKELLPQYPGAKFKGPDDLAGFASCLAESADIILRNAPEYLNWVAEVIRFVAPVHSPTNLRGSSSSPKFSGMISISDDPDPLLAAEFLVHEASHQYLAIASSLGEMDEGPEQQLYYSRFARRERPLERILAAFHALGNIALFYEKCLANGIPCEERLAYVSTHLREVDCTLQSADTLTPIGRSLWLPLSEKTGHLNLKADETVSNAALAEADRVMAGFKAASL